MIASSYLSSQSHKRTPQTANAICKNTTATHPIWNLVGRSICLLALSVLTPRAYAMVPVQVDDLRSAPGPWGRAAYPPGEYVVIGNNAFFFADDGISGVELWRTDGTNAGTQMVRDIHPGSGSSLPTALTRLGRTLFFAADDGTHGVELWKSDGTTAGTVLVKDIRLGPDNSWPGGLATAGRLQISPIEPAVRFDQNTTDDAHAGEAILSANPGSPTPLARSGVQHAPLIRRAKLFFRADDGVHGSELWASDGTEAGTTMVSDILPGPGASAPQHLTDVRGRLFFTARTDATGTELWKSDGTEAGTQLVADVAPGSMDSAIGHLTPVGGRLFFTADNGDTGLELWKSDGTAAGTQLVKDINDDLVPTSGITAPSSPASLTNVNGTLFFTADDGILPDYSANGAPNHGRELWKSDGTEAGTVLVKDISFNEPDFANFPIRGSSPAFLTNINGTLFFIASQIVNDSVFDPDTTLLQLWKSDGTETGTVLVTGVPNPPLSQTFQHIVEMARVGDNLFFSGVATLLNQANASALELWKSDGTTAGTMQVADIRPGETVGSTPRSLTNLNGTLLFEATTTGMNRQLWRSDGTEAGTTLVRDIQPQSGSAVPNSLTDVDGTLFFTADDGISGVELWKTDGTQAGTSLVDDLRPGIFGSVPRRLTNVGGTLFFSVDDESSGLGEELWKLDPVTNLPILVSDIRTDPGFSSTPEFLTDFGGTLYFKAFLGGQIDDSSPTTTNGHQLWKSDGTTAGTVLVADLWPNSTTSPFELTTVGTTLFMAADDGINGEELWKSDGTLAGTVMVKNIVPGADGAEPQELTSAGGVLFFVADGGSGNGRELWRSDGTIAGTQLVKDIRPGVISSNPRNLAGVGGMLYFTANDGLHGDELWISDGTTAGTVMVADLVPGPLSSLPSFIVDAGPLFGAVFAAYDVNDGVELWQSDGTAAGTMPITDIAPGIASSNPQFMTVSGGRLFFTANDHVNGWELWTFPLQ